MRERSVARFVGIFALWFALFEVALRVPWADEPFQRYLELNAAAAAGLLSLFYDGLQVGGAHIIGREYNLVVARGCDALEPSAIFLAALLAYPARPRQRVAGAAVGVSILAAANVVRIASLYAVGAHRPDVFETVHLEVWQLGFIALSVLLWIAWAAWSERVPRPET